MDTCTALEDALPALQPVAALPREEQARVFAAVLDVAADAVLVTEAEPVGAPGPRIVYVNPAFTRHTGYAAEEVLGRSPRLLQGPGTDRAELDRLRRALAAWRPVQVELLNHRKDGTPFWTELSIAPLADERGWFTHWVSVQRDVTARKRREERLAEQLQLARNVLDSLPAQTAVLDHDGTVLAVNQAWEQFWVVGGGSGPTGVVGGNYLTVCDDATGPCSEEAVRVATGIRDVVAGERDRYALDYECSSPDERRWFHLQVVPLRAGQRTGGPRQVLVSHSDITARKQGELALEHQAQHDALTGLANRLLLLDRLRALLAGDGSTPVSLLFLDLDGFKSVNDSLGHAAGDDLLRVVAGRLRAVVREQDLVARLGGDEFVVCCSGLDTEGAIAQAERLAEAVGLPVQVGGLELRVSISTGVVTSGPGAVAEGLLRDADAAMYLAKASGRGRVEVFVEELRARAHRRLTVAAGLRRALDDGDLVLHLQPVVDLATEAVVGREALLRWRCEGQLLLPGAFLDVAAEAGMLPEIGAWVLLDACRQAAARHALGDEATIAVNVAAEQLRDRGLADAVAGALAVSGLPPSSLVLEVTEHSVLSDVGAAVDVLAGLREQGVRVALDDFGTGFSSLSHLARFPVDVLKVDRQFVAGQDRAHRAILRAVGSLGAVMGLEVVAEGVETREQAERARLAGCTHGQGWLFGRPAELPSALPPAGLTVPSPRRGRTRRRGDDGGQART